MNLRKKKEEYLLKQAKFCRVLSEDLTERGEVWSEATGFKEILNLTKEGVKNSVESALYENIKKRIKNESFKFTEIINKSIDEVFEDDIEYLSRQKKLIDKIYNDKDKDEDNDDINSEEGNNSNEEIKGIGESEYDKNDYYNNFTSFMSQKLDEVN